VIENMDIRQFMKKRKSISDSRSMKNISNKRWRIELRPAQTKAWFARDAAEPARHFRRMRLDRLSIHR